MQQVNAQLQSRPMMSARSAGAAGFVVAIIIIMIIAMISDNFLLWAM